MCMMILRFAACLTLSAAIAVFVSRDHRYEPARAAAHPRTYRRTARISAARMGEISRTLQIGQLKADQEFFFVK